MRMTLEKFFAARAMKKRLKAEFNSVGMTRPAYDPYASEAAYGNHGFAVQFTEEGGTPLYWSSFTGLSKKTRQKVSGEISYAPTQGQFYLSRVKPL